jgi:hypothetical protein
VYPHPARVAVLGGYRAIWLNQAIECWAHVLELAGRRVSELLTADDWAALAVALEDSPGRRGPRFDTSISHPGAVLADMLQSLAPAKATERLGRLCTNLDYVQAWAVIWAVQWYWEHGGQPKGEWWTPEYRRRHAEAHGSGQAKD